MAIKKKKVAFLYPGQGAQMPGMGLDFYEQNSAAAAVVDTAQSVLDFDVKSLCFAKNDLLNRTEYTQPCLVTCCLAMTAAILETGIAPNMTAGLSLGEYAAIATAGAMDIKTALLLVRRRGLLMQNATKDGFGGMAAVLGLEPDVLEALLKNTDAVTVANYNCPGQQVITGETQALLAMIPRLKENGAKVIPLKVSGPFHSPFMKPAGEKLERELEQVRLSELQIPYVSNVSAQPITKTEQIRFPAFPGGLFSCKVGAEHEDDACRRCRVFCRDRSGAYPEHLVEKNKCRGKDLYGFYHGGSCKNAGFSERNGIKGEKIEK